MDWATGFFLLESERLLACSLSPRSPPVSIPDDVDPDSLISRLAGPLAPVPCAGEGAAYRAVAPLQRSYFDPPNDHRAGWDISQESRASKLRAAPAIEHGRDLRVTRRFKLGG
jgi:hypothetical protein